MVILNNTDQTILWRNKRKLQAVIQTGQIMTAKEYDAVRRNVELEGVKLGSCLNGKAVPNMGHGFFDSF